MVETRLLVVRQGLESRKKPTFHETTAREISSYGRSVELCCTSEYFRDTSVSPKSWWVSLDLCEAGVITACDGSRMPATGVTSQAVRLELRANRTAQSFSRFH